jgi:hypothetical protein
MFYGMRVFEQLQVWRTVFAVIAGALLLDVLVLALLSRRYRASPFLRLLLAVTLALAVSAGVLAGLTEWQIHTLDIFFPFIRLPDGTIHYLTPPVVGVIYQAVPALIIGAVLVLLLGGLELVGLLARGLRRVGCAPCSET